MPLKIKILILLGLVVTAAQANQRYSNSCQQGGKQVITSGVIGAPRVQGSYPQCQVTVYLTGTLTLASIFSDNSGTVKANPFTANIDGSYFFYAANSRYDVTMSGGGLPAPVTIGDILLADPAGGGTTVSSITAGSGISVNQSTGAVTVTNTWGAIPSGSQFQHLRIKPNTGNNTTLEFTGVSYKTTDFTWTQTPGGSLTGGGGAQSITLTPCPLGVVVSGATATPIYITGGTGTAEAITPTGGTCTSGAATGTIIVAPANNHSGAWTITTASFFLQEAVNVVGAAGGGGIEIPSGTYVLYATVRIRVNDINIQGAGPRDLGGNTGATYITRTGDFGDSIYVNSGTGATLNNVHISGMTLEQVINYVAGSPPTLSNRPTSGAHIHLQDCSKCSAHHTETLNMPYGIELDTIGYSEVYRNTLKSVWDNVNANAQIGIAGMYLHHSEFGAGYPTYLWVKDNVILGYASVARNITVNGNVINLVEPVGAKDGILVESCEVCWITGNSIEWQNGNGINIKAAAAHAPVTDALLAIDISDNYIDRNRTNGILLDMSADEDNRFALGTKINNNLILGSGATINLIKFTGAVAPPKYIRLAHETLISNNVLRFGLGSSIFMLAGSNTKITGNLIHGYNELNSYPLNTLSCSAVSGICTGDRMGNSGVFMTEATLGTVVTGNTIGGNYLGNTYAGGAYTVNGVTIGELINQSTSEGDTITAPNTDGGVQVPSTRSVAAAYDPAFFNPQGPMRGAARSSVAVTVCGALDVNSTVAAGFITSATTGACAPVLTFTNALAANGWACSINNRTTANLIRQTASTTGSATFSGTTVSGDVLSYSCTAY